MHRASDLLGMTMVENSDSPWGRVGEVYVDFPREQIGALSVVCSGKGRPGLIPASAVAFGSDFLRASSQALCRGANAAILRQGKIPLVEVQKMLAVTNAGQELGKVADLVLEGLQLIALELSEGLLQDLFEGRYALSLPVRADLVRGKLMVSDSGNR